MGFWCWQQSRGLEVANVAIASFRPGAVAAGSLTFSFPKPFRKILGCSWVRQSGPSKWLKLDPDFGAVATRVELHKRTKIVEPAKDIPFPERFVWSKPIRKIPGFSWSRQSEPSIGVKLHQSINLVESAENVPFPERSSSKAISEDTWT